MSEMSLLIRPRDLDIHSEEENIFLTGNEFRTAGKVKASVKFKAMEKEKFENTAALRALRSK